MRVPVPLAQASRLFNHGPVTLVCSAHGGRRNVMAASWAMPLDFDPPKVAVVIDKGAYTRQLVEASGRFVLAIPGRGLAREVLAVGSSSGRDGDKFAALGLRAGTDPHGDELLVEGCVAWLACELLPEPHNQQAYDLFLAQVSAAWADDRAYRQGRWVFEDEALRTLHYVAGGHFFATGEALDVSLD